ncbi:MATE family efflux transporter [Gallibacter intestinalis]|uniref:Probable multidrug resistance protein NorM n=1 Tax=Gallibacter intestinalis TaxID=2779356 RepID=A0ABR9QYI2_9FIRM|nr:MATE family efflux transporter [Gallibacter intestinalis]MBE5035635.1 MATE family efflux transporter [Gallibacter intestinalis]
MNRDLTKGNIGKNMLLFSLPLMVGNLLQQLYNLVDTWVVGRFVGADALAAVGASYSLMVFLTSVYIGLCMGSGSAFSMFFGKRDEDSMKKSFFSSFVLIGAVSIIINVGVYLFMDPLISILQIPESIRQMTEEYMSVIFAGMFFVFIYNYFANLLRSVGNSVVPLVFLAISAVLNIVLDLLFVPVWEWGVFGAALATIIAQGVSAVGIAICVYVKYPELRIEKKHMKLEIGIVKRVFNMSFFTSLQQSVMNFGILMIQGLVNSFGTSVMAAFAAAVKIDTFAYMPAQDFGNGFSTYIAQNYGAGKGERIKQGIKKAVISSGIFCVCISVIVCVFARPLMMIFIDPSESEIIDIGVVYLRIEGTFYIGIGMLFLLYGFYRGVSRPAMSLVLTVISLGSRVAIAYAFAGILGVNIIWAAVPIGWILADVAGILYYRKYRRIILSDYKV